MHYFKHYKTQGIMLLQTKFKLTYSTLLQITLLSKKV